MSGTRTNARAAEWSAPEASAFAGLVRRSRWRFAMRALFLGILCIVVVLVTGFGIFAWHISSLTAPAEPRKADAIIVLTGGHSRLDAAIDLLKSGKGQRLLISGVNPVAGEADLIRASGADAGLFSCCVDLDHAALDTIGNAEESAKWMRQHAYGSVIVVTNNYHMPRSLLEMKRLLGSADLQPYPVVNTPLDSGKWLTKPRALRVLVTEYSKFLAALARGMVQGSSETAENATKIAQAGTLFD